jgi:hypothetical protein
MRNSPQRFTRLQIWKRNRINGNQIGNVESEKFIFALKLCVPGGYRQAKMSPLKIKSLVSRSGCFLFKVSVPQRLFFAAQQRIAVT